MNPQQPYDPNQPPQPYNPNQPPPYNPNQPPNVYPPPPYYQQNQYPGYLPSANGGTILFLGIISFFCFGIVLGPVAWVMGNSSLALIDSGQANPMERGNVAARRICGMLVALIAAGAQSHP